MKTLYFSPPVYFRYSGIPSVYISMLPLPLSLSLSLSLALVLKAYALSLNFHAEFPITKAQLTASSHLTVLVQQPLS